MWEGRTGGFSYLDPESTIEGNHLGGRAELIEGVGLAYRDAPPQQPIDYETARQDGDFEFCYFIYLGSGDIFWCAGGSPELHVDRAPDRELRWEVGVSKEATWQFYVYRGNTVITKNNGQTTRYKRRESAQKIADRLNKAPDFGPTR